MSTVPGSTTLRTDHIYCDTNARNSLIGIGGTVGVTDVFTSSVQVGGGSDIVEGMPGWSQPSSVTNTTSPLWRMRFRTPTGDFNWDGGGFSTSVADGNVTVRSIFTSGQAPYQNTLVLGTPGLEFDNGGGRVRAGFNSTNNLWETIMISDQGFAGSTRSYVHSSFYGILENTDTTSTAWTCGAAPDNGIWAMNNYGSTLSDSAAILVRSANATPDGFMSCRLGGTGNATYQNTVHFHYNASTTSRGDYAGNFSINQNNWTIQSSSDYRLKTNVETMMDGLDTLRRLRPRRFNWVADPDGESVVGFIAREYQEVLPDAVALPPDSVDRDGNPQYQLLDPASAIPTLVAAIIQLKAQVDELDAELGLEQKSWL